MVDSCFCVTLFGFQHVKASYKKAASFNLKALLTNVLNNQADYCFAMVCFGMKPHKYMYMNISYGIVVAG